MMWQSVWKNHRMESTVGLGIVNSFQLVFLLCSLPIAIPIILLWIFCFQVQGGLCTDGSLWSHPYISSADLLFSSNLFCTIAWGIAASFGGVFSFDFSVLTKVGVGTSFTLGGIGHDDLATNKFVEAGTVFGHGVSSLVGGAVNVTVVVALGCCCAVGGLLQLGWMGFLPPGTSLLWGWGFLELWIGSDCTLSMVLGLAWEQWLLASSLMLCWSHCSGNHFWFCAN